MRTGGGSATQRPARVQEGPPLVGRREQTFRAQVGVVSPNINWRQDIRQLVAKVVDDTSQLGYLAQICAHRSVSSGWRSRDF